MVAKAGSKAHNAVTGADPSTDFTWFQAGGSEWSEVQSRNPHEVIHGIHEGLDGALIPAVPGTAKTGAGETISNFDEVDSVGMTYRKAYHYPRTGDLVDPPRDYEFDLISGPDGDTLVSVPDGDVLVGSEIT